MPDLQQKLKRIGRGFHIAGDYIFGEPYGSGHINDTFAATYHQGQSSIRVIHQRMNEHVFPEPQKLMENISRITNHQYRKLVEAGESDISRACLQLIPSREEKSFYIDEEGKSWRTYKFIENARSYDLAETPKQAYEAAAAFGRFQKILIDLPGERLHEIIPDFHNTPKRFEVLRQAAQEDGRDRLKFCEKEFAFAGQRESMTSLVVSLMNEGQMPERICHNDTKLNNVLFDDTTQRGICVIDLDTVMPGSAVYDFGDLVRTCTSPAAEDEKDPEKVCVRTPMFEAVAGGYLSETRDFLTDVEKEYLGVSGKLMAFEVGIRFLADFLNGDAYFKTKYAEHNLVRCRTQFGLVRSLEENEGRIHRIIQRCLEK